MDLRPALAAALALALAAPLCAKEKAKKKGGDDYANSRYKSKNMAPGEHHIIRAGKSSS